MKFGLYLPNFGAFDSARLLADLAQEAEEAGWDGFFIWDHIARAWLTGVVDPWVALSAVAMNTHTIRIGAMVTPLPRRRPWKVARETVSLDRLSDGRLVFGAGIGGPGGSEVEWNNFGEEMDLKRRAEMLDEGLEILTGLWSGEPFASNGRHYRVQESQFLPTPVQAPRIPVWVGGNWPHRAPFRRAARWDGVFPQLRAENVDELTQFKDVVSCVRQQRTSLEPFDIVYCTAPGKTAEQAAIYASAGATWWLEELYPQHFGCDWQDEWPLEAMRRVIRQGPAKP